MFSILINRLPYIDSQYLQTIGYFVQRLLAKPH